MTSPPRRFTITNFWQGFFSPFLQHETLTSFLLQLSQKIRQRGGQSFSCFSLYLCNLGDQSSSVVPSDSLLLHFWANFRACGKFFNQPRPRRPQTAFNQAAKTLYTCFNTSFKRSSSQRMIWSAWPIDELVFFNAACYYVQLFSFATCQHETTRKERNKHWRRYMIIAQEKKC